MKKRYLPKAFNGLGTEINMFQNIVAYNYTNNSSFFGSISGWMNVYNKLNTICVITIIYIGLALSEGI